MYTEEKKMALRAALVNHGHMLKQQLSNAKATRELLQSRTTLTDQNVLDGANKNISFLFYLHELTEDFQKELESPALSPKLNLPDECPFVS